MKSSGKTYPSGVVIHRGGSKENKDGPTVRTYMTSNEKIPCQEADYDHEGCRCRLRSEQPVGASWPKQPEQPVVGDTDYNHGQSEQGGDDTNVAVVPTDTDIMNYALLPTSTTTSSSRQF